MDITTNQMRRYIYEYVFQQAVAMHNVNEEQYASRNNKNPNIIRTSQARGLRKNMDRIMQSQNSSLETMSRDSFLQLVNTVFDQEHLTKPFDFSNTRNATDKIPNAAVASYQVMLNNFINMAGIRFDNDHYRNNWLRLNLPNSFMPISSYDPRFSDLNSMLQRGSKFAAIAANTNIQASDITKLNVATKLPIFERFEGNGHVTGDNFEMRPTNQKLYGKEDMLGLSRLRLWMTNDEYRQIHDWVVNSVDWSKPITKEMLNSYKQMTDRAVHILHGLKEEGYSYKIDKARSLGQIIAKIDGTNLQVRITDTPENSDYIGRVYNTDGVSASFSTSAYHRTKDGKREMDKVNPTPEDSLNLVNLALGYPVKKRINRNGNTYRIPIGMDYIYNRTVNMTNIQYHTTYRHYNGFATVLRGNGDSWGNVIRANFNTRMRGNRTTRMSTQKVADSYLRHVISSARKNFSDQVGLDNLIKLAKQQQETGEKVAVDFSSDVAINEVQHNIWRELVEPTTSDYNTVLLKPGVKREDLIQYYKDNLDKNGNAKHPEEFAKGLLNYQYSPKLSREAQAKNYLRESLNYFIGKFNLDNNGKRFNPASVIRYQESAEGTFRSRNDLIKAIGKDKINLDELKGDPDEINDIKNKLVKFDSKSATPMKNLQSPFMQSMYNAISGSLYENGVHFKPEDILIDKNGIVQYKGQIADSESVISSKTGQPNALKDVSGHIGQIFEPNKQGIIYTKFAGDNNYALIPGYDATILPQEDGQNLSVEERTRLIGYKQHMIQNIRYTLRYDLMDGDSEHTEDNVGLNNTYRQLYGEKKDYDFVKQYQEQGMDQKYIDAIVKTEAEKVRYSNDIRDGSTIDAAYQAEHDNADLANDNNNNAYSLTGGRDMSILTEESDGYFDPIASNATTTNQGIVRFLTKDAQVDDNGRITPGDKNSRCSIFDLDDTKHMNYDPFDRQNMTISNILHSNSITPKIGVALTTIDGWNQDDGVVVSKDFAEKFQVRGEDGKLRPAKIGDKILDYHGNKGVINLVVDPNMDPKEAEKQGLTDVVKLFKNNPSLSVAMAPFSAVSRYNGGTARDMMEDAEPLIGLDGEKIEGGIGHMHMIITDKAADKKTKVYTEEDFRNGKGRKISAQLAWVLNAKGANKVAKEAFGQNDMAMSDLNEYLTVMGLGMDNYGNFEKMSDKTLKGRRMIDPPKPEYTSKGNISKAKIDSNFAKELDRGGVMQLPFEIKLANDETTSNKVPVLSSYLRSGQDLQDGTSIAHEYTNDYEKMYYNGAVYTDLQQKSQELQQKGQLNDKEQDQLKQYQDKMKTLVEKAQDAYDSMTNDIKQRKFEGKHNIFKDKIMSKRMRHSATSIWTADPRLDIDTMKVSPEIAKNLKVKNGQKALFWRDPILRDGGVRFMKIDVDPHLTGIAVNPSCDLSFDGDFDGDTIGIVGLQNKDAIKEAEDKFSIKNNLLDYGSKSNDPEKPYKLYFQDSLDIKVAQYKDPSLAKRWDDLTKQINKFEKAYTDKRISADEVDQKREQAVRDISDYYKDCYETVGMQPIQYNNVKDHLKSLKEACLDTGAKGSPAKFADYAQWFGANLKQDSKGNFDFDTVTDAGHTLSTREMQQAVMYATAVKSFGTGNAGAFSQRGIKALRNVEPKAVLELTYPVTQALLQVKHDPDQAKKIYGALKGPVRALWQGNSMSRDGNGNWHVNKDTDGKPIKASTKDWVDTFMDMYTQDLGVDPNPDYVKSVANALSDKQGNMQNIEEVDSISVMDKLAYGGKFKDVVAVANEHKNLFAGKNNQVFASDKLRINVENAKKFLAKRAEMAKQGIQMVDEMPGTESFAKADTQEGYTAKAKDSKGVVVQKKEINSKVANKVFEENAKQVETQQAQEKVQAEQAQRQAMQKQVQETKQRHAVEDTITQVSQLKPKQAIDYAKESNDKKKEQQNYVLPSFNDDTEVPSDTDKQSTMDASLDSTQFTR